jgi:putative oxidoreductase
MSTIAAVIGRILVALLFVVSGATKLLDPGPAAGMLTAAGLSPALTIPTGLFEIALGVALAIGWMIRLSSLLLAGFTVLAILFFHNQFNDPAQLPTILLHVALIGGLLAIFAHSQVWWSYDSLRQRRAEDHATRAAEERRHEAELRAARAEGRADGIDPPPVLRRRRWF